QGAHGRGRAHGAREPQAGVQPGARRQGGHCGFRRARMAANPAARAHGLALRLRRDGGGDLSRGSVGMTRRQGSGKITLTDTDKNGRAQMLELYHSINSVCAQKIRIALLEKGLEAREHLMTLRGDQFDPVYMKLNPNAVVPTLIHDGNVIVESSIILYYLEDAFP